MISMLIVETECLYVCTYVYIIIITIIYKSKTICTHIVDIHFPSFVFAYCPMYCTNMLKEMIMQITKDTI